VDVAPTAPATPEKYPEIDRGWLRRPALDAEALRSLALFASLDDTEARRVLLTAHEHHAVDGETIVEQWQVSRELYVVLEGHVEVTADGKVVNSIRAGGFFGELAAIDWGAAFGRTRVATVTATLHGSSSSTGCLSTG
jgi:CRP-like cAMP-binding protein